MRFGLILGCLLFAGLYICLTSGNLWLRHALATQQSRIVFSHLEFDNYEVYVMDADGGSRENLSNHPVDDFDPDWSPDGTKIAFVSNRSGLSQIHVMDADGKKSIRLTDGPQVKRHPDWSPDGGKIAFTVGGGISHIDVMDADGRNRLRHENNASEPSWSPDGQQIAFVSWRHGSNEIYVIGADRRGLERVTHDLARKWSPSFSPDGGRIAYWGEDEGFHHIYVVRADGKNLMRLTHNQEHHFHPTWTPDGMTIAYASSNNNENIFLGAKIHLMTADGKYLKQLSDVHVGIDYQPDFRPIGLAVSPTSNTATIWARLKKRALNLR